MFTSRMDDALTEARAAATRGEVPVGAVLCDPAGRVVAADGNLDPDQWLRTYFVAGGLMTVLRQQAADSPASAVGTEEMAHALQRTMRTVLRSGS